MQHNQTLKVPFELSTDFFRTKQQGLFFASIKALKRINFWSGIWRVLLRKDAVSVNEGILEEFHLSTPWVSFAGSVTFSNLTNRDCQLLYTCIWKLSKSRQVFLPSSLALSLQSPQQHFSKKKKKKGEAFPFSCLCFWLKCQYFLLASFLITRNCGRWKTKKRNISICLPIDKQFLLCGEVLPTAILTPAPLRAQCSASVCRGAQPHLRQLLLKPTWKTSTVNSSFLLRTAAILYGDIKRLKDPGQLRLITSLEKQITPFSADPLLLARPAISKLWKKEKEREREASDSRAEPKVTSNAARIWNLRGKKE